MPLTVAIILPCLNEEATLRSTCASLGFGTKDGHQPTDCFLFIVDNRSSDRTARIAQEVRASSRPGTVFVTQEDERGYVPARHAGVEVATRTLAGQAQIPSESVLALQADADTIYTAGYVDAMRSASELAGRGGLVSGLAELPADFILRHAGYQAMVQAIDHAALYPLAPATPDVICCDAVCGYRLDQYFAWGGHRREYDPNGDEILAETTRLYLRSLLHGTFLVHVDTAIAYPSPRKIVTHPAREFASAGFPRNARWKSEWDSRYERLGGINELISNQDNLTVRASVRTRKRHSVALFGLLPVHVSRALDREPPPNQAQLAEVAGQVLPHRDSETVTNQPGILLSDVLALVDDERVPLEEIPRCCG